jgi:hypothetical protein
MTNNIPKYYNLVEQDPLCAFKQCKVDVICKYGDEYEVYYNNFVVFEDGSYYDTEGNKVDDVTAWRYR